MERLFWVDDVETLFGEISGRGATIEYGLCDQFYDVREFAVRDPDAQSFGFGQVLSKTGQATSAVRGQS